MLAKRSKILLNFPEPELERAFQSEYFRQKKKSIQFALATSLVFFAAYGLFDYWMASTEMTAVALVRYVVVCPFIAFVIWMTTTQIYPRNIQILICIGTVLASVGAMVVTYYTELERSYLYVSGLLVILLWFHLFSGVLTRYALVTSFVVCVVYVVFAYAVIDYPLYVAINNSTFLISAVVIAGIANYLIEGYNRNEFTIRRQLDLERKKNEDLLHNIFPPSIVEELKKTSGTIAHGCDSVTILFADIVGFTEFSAHNSPKRLVEYLNSLFCRFDNLVDAFGLEKIKTIGDAYMVVSGLPVSSARHAQSAIEFALAMQRELDAFNRSMNLIWQLRIGIHSGPAIAGVIGVRKFVYDVWGDTVNVASRMESAGAPNRIHVTEATFSLLKNEYEFESRDPITIKGKGLMHTYFLIGRKDHLSMEVDDVDRIERRRNYNERIRYYLNKGNRSDNSPRGV